MADEPIIRVRDFTAAYDGAVIIDDISFDVQSGEGIFAILELQPPGKRPMGAADFLRGSGRSLQIGATFGER